eukprot:CAMPEP_0115194490 /NCGR_PEP_ID=MMETSP0270-20121206/14098_1 /TAXON_ID=71861 /ORGANISM="Scrippsiella trochoidea, Strain CCMP3099" /LENGTH=58 /DNA_ID=CAMNT_0002607795 /DNA_START=374 /DNA_END=547 /DNA_ORIENTATION=-
MRLLLLLVVLDIGILELGGPTRRKPSNALEIHLFLALAVALLAPHDSLPAAAAAAAAA